MYWSATSGHDVVSVRAWRRYSSAVTTPRSTMTPSMRRVPGPGPARRFRVTATMSTSLDSVSSPWASDPCTPTACSSDAPAFAAARPRPARPRPTAGCGRPGGVAEVGSVADTPPLSRSGQVARGAAPLGCGVAVDAVIFDWGGTLTPWITCRRPRLVADRRAAGAGRTRSSGSARCCTRPRRRSGAAAGIEHRSGTLAEVFAAGGLTDRRGRLRRPRRRVGARDVHRPGRGRRAGRAAGADDPGRRAVQHRLDPRPPPADLRPRRGRPPHRRGRLHERDPVDQAASGGVPGGDGGGRGDRSGPVRVRRRPAVRRHLRRPPGRHARGPGAAQRHPGCPTWTHAGRAGRGHPAPDRPAAAWSTAGPASAAPSGTCADRARRPGARSRRTPARP